MDEVHLPDENEMEEVVAAQEVLEIKPPRQVRTKRPITTQSVLPSGEVVAKKATRPRKPRPNAKKQINPDSRKGYKHDWPEIKRMFVEGAVPEGIDPTSETREFPTLKQVAERNNVSYDTLRSRSSDERWYDQRQEYLLRIGKARQAKRIQEMGKESYDFDQNTLKVAKLGMGMVTARMSEIAREVQEAKVRRDEAIKLQQAGYPVDPHDLMTVIDARELGNLASAAVQWQLLGQKALGTDITRMEIQHDIQHDISVDVEVTTIAAELGRDDPDRLAAFLQAANRAGLLELVMNQDKEQTAIDGDPDGIVDAEIVEETG